MKCKINLNQPYRFTVQHNRDSLGEVLCRFARHGMGSAVDLSVLAAGLGHETPNKYAGEPQQRTDEKFIEYLVKLGFLMEADHS